MGERVGPWKMYAGRMSVRGRMHVCAHPRSVEIYGDEPVAVVVSVDAAGTHWGWQEAERDSEGPEMIQPHRGMYTMQFAYGPEAEEARGRGRTVKLRVEDAGCE